MMEAVFLDRDGVINHERADYVKSWEEFQWLPGSLEAVCRLSTLGIPIIVITNQSAIGRGVVDAESVKAIHRRLRAEVEEAGGRIDAFYLCPHAPAVGCTCRKPQPGLLLAAARDFGLTLARCVFIGDSITDYQAALQAGCNPILVRSGRQADQLPKLVGDAAVPLVANLQEAIELLTLQQGIVR